MNKDTDLYIKFINREYLRRLDINPRYSLRAYSKFIRIDIGTLSQVLSNKRTLSLKKAKIVLSKLDLSINDQNLFLSSLAQSHHQGSRKRISPELRKILKQLKENSFTNGAIKSLEIDQFSVIADWYHYAILELTFVSNFQSNPKWIARQLGISKFQANLAIKRLKDQGLLVETKDGNLAKSNKQLTTGDRHNTSVAHKRRQKQVLEKSIESLERDSIGMRNHSAMTFAIDPKLLPEAKKRINDFMNEMTLFLENGKQEKIYEFIINLFPLVVE